MSRDKRDTAAIMPMEGCGNNKVCPDHIHMLVSITEKISVSEFMGCMKGKSELLIFQKWEI